ncbi:hypothetical protein Trydic_g4181 [Trypoxylus dichotomus]
MIEMNKLQWISTRENINYISNLIGIHCRLVSSALDWNDFLNPSLILTLSLYVGLTIRMSDFMFVLIRDFLIKGTMDVHVSIACLARIIFCVIHFRFNISNWVNMNDEAQKTATYVHDIWNNLASKNEIDCYAKELQLIALQLYNSKLSFTAYGFFELDWTLLHKARKTSTYIHDFWNKSASKGEIDCHLKHLQFTSLQLYNNRLSFTAFGFFDLDWTLWHRVRKYDYERAKR